MFWNNSSVKVFKVRVLFMIVFVFMVMVVIMIVVVMRALKILS